MSHVNLELHRPLEEYVSYLRKLNRRTAAMIGSFWEPRMIFQDPYFDVKGADKAQSVIENRFKVSPDSRYEIQDYYWTTREDTAHITWRFLFTYKERLLTSQRTKAFINGVSEVCFLPNGKILSQSDFWGAHDHFPVKAYKKLEL
ncbi:MAG: hypothetical protein GC137_04980 [Alphaproteobacteria bacterium]|nr:hypothetical protein [Alphaproteobacteria bacterium]